MSGEDEVEEEIEGEDERREAAIASTPCLQPGFKPNSISKDQVSKLHDLHKRRLKIKSKIRKKLKDGNSRSDGKDLNLGSSKHSVSKTEHSKATNLTSSEDSIDFSAQQDNVAVLSSPKMRRKLYWGLDTRERWERKANM